MDEPILKSSITGKEYKISEVVRVVNMKQAALYIKNCVFPRHIYCGQASNSQNKETDVQLTFLFDKGESKWCYDLWCKKELR